MIEFINKDRQEIDKYSANYLIEKPINLDDYKNDVLGLLITLNLLSSKKENTKLERVKKNLQFFFWLIIIGNYINCFSVYER